MTLIYLDYNATTPIAVEVREAMLPYFSEYYGNPSSAHLPGRKCREAIDAARGRVASLLGANADEITFTSGGTEANNAVFKGLAYRVGAEKGHFVISAMEHPAVTEPARFLEQQGFELTIVGCDATGLVNVDEIEKAIRPTTLLVSIMHANNEIGTIQPIAEISKICRDRKVLLHTDAAQTIGKIPARVDELGVDFLSIAGHKLYAPKGVGALYVRGGIKLEPFMHGAGHESGRRAGTENTPYIVGLGTAAEMAKDHIAAKQSHLGKLRDRLYERLRSEIGDALTFNGHPERRLPNTLSANFANVRAKDLLESAPDVCASTGAACHADSVKLSDTMTAIGLLPQVARGTVRLSVGWPTTHEEIDRAAELLINAWKSVK